MLLVEGRKPLEVLSGGERTGNYCVVSYLAAR